MENRKRKIYRYLVIALSLIPIACLISIQMFYRFSTDIFQSDKLMYSTYFMLLRQNIIPEEHQYFYIHKLEREPFMSLAFNGEADSVKERLNAEKYTFKSMGSKQKYETTNDVYISKYGGYIAIKQDGTKVDVYIDTEKAYEI